MIAAIVVISCMVDGYMIPHIRMRSRILRAKEPLESDVQDQVGPRFKRVEEDSRVKKKEKKSGAEMNTINARLLAEIEEAKASVRIEAPQIERREQIDISDVNPVLYAASSVVTVIAAYFLFQFSIFVAAQFAEHPFASDLYPVERFANFLRQALIAGLSLLTGLTGLTAVGLFLLAATVALANIQGTTPSAFPLDPPTSPLSLNDCDKDNSIPPRDSSNTTSST
mmetsp:Transcript_4038/g.5671  ORF Transcript_4038/g.5671 Transcript_4038/m.5671 type:complete len:225 (+) Transcript_4038:56-730(+)